MKMHINLTRLKKRIVGLEQQSVTVGVLDKDVKSASINWKKGIGRLSGQDGGSVKRRYVRQKGRAKNTPLHKVASYLNKEKGIFSDVLDNANNKDLVEVVKQFSIMDKSHDDIQRLINACQALVRNPILRGDYNPNSKAWIDKKGFDHYGIATGTLFKNITAVYKTW